MFRLRLLPLVFLFAVPAYADTYTLEFFTETGPAPTSTGFEWDPVEGRFITQVVADWDVGFVHLSQPLGLGAGNTSNTSPIAGCPANTRTLAWFSLITGQCGTLHWSYFLMHDGFVKYEIETRISSDVEILLINAAGIGYVGEFVPQQAFARGTVVAHPVPEPSSVALLAVGLGLLLRARRSFPSP